jgi:hypothetical protein
VRADVRAAQGSGLSSKASRPLHDV